MQAKTHFFLLRGLIRHHGHWGNFPTHLQSNTKDATIHYLDLLGNGPHCDKHSPLHLDAYVEQLITDTKDIFKMIQKPYRAYCLAYSLGAMAALRWSHLATQEHSIFFPFHHLACINTSAANLIAPHKRFPLKAIPKVLKALAQFSPKTIEQIILELTVSEPEKFKAIFDEFTSLHQKFPITTSNFTRQVLAGARFVAKKPLKSHTTFIRSLNDQLVAPESSMALAKYFETDLLTHPWAGHDLALEDPVWLCSLYRYSDKEI